MQSPVFLGTLLLLCMVFAFAATEYPLITLDSFTFHKILPHSRSVFVVLFWNKRFTGQKLTETSKDSFINFAENSVVRRLSSDDSSKDVVFGQIILNGAQNGKLAEKFGLRLDFERPRVLIFPAGSDKAIVSPENFAITTQGLTKQIFDVTKLYVNIPGIIEPFALVASRYRAAADPIAKAEVVKLAEKTLETVLEYEKEDAQLYINTIKSLQEFGPSYGPEEEERLSKLLESDTLDDLKRSEVKAELNVLHQFVKPSKPDPKAKKSEL